MSKKKLTDDALEKIKELRGRNMILEEIATEMGMSKSSVFSALKLLGAPRLRRRVGITKATPTVVDLLQDGHSRAYQRGPVGRENIQVGALTEAVVTAELLRLGATVLHPWGGGTCYDIVAHLPSGKFVRVQCKTARPINRQPHALTFSAVYQAANGVGRRSKVPYTPEQIDGFAVWSPATSHLMWIPLHCVTALYPSFNLDENKRGWKGLTHPDEFPFEALLNS